MHTFVELGIVIFLSSMVNIKLIQLNIININITHRYVIHITMIVNCNYLLK